MAPDVRKNFEPRMIADNSDSADFFNPCNHRNPCESMIRDIWKKEKDNDRLCQNSD